MFYVLCNRTLRPAWMHRLMFGFGLHTVQYILPIYHGHKPLRQLQPYQVRFLCVNSVLRQCSSFLKVFHRSSETLTSLQQVQEHLNVFMRLAPARYHLDTETRVAVYICLVFVLDINSYHTVSCAPSLTDSDFLQRFGNFLGQITDSDNWDENHHKTVSNRLCWYVRVCTITLYSTYVRYASNPRFVSPHFVNVLFH